MRILPQKTQKRRTSFPNVEKFRRWLYAFLQKQKREEASMATKGLRKAPPGAPKYHRLTEEKRIIIETLRKEGCSKRHMAERVGCHLALPQAKGANDSVCRQELPNCHARGRAVSSVRSCRSFAP